MPLSRRRMSRDVAGPRSLLGALVPLAVIVTPVHPTSPILYHVLL